MHAFEVMLQICQSWVHVHVLCYFYLAIAQVFTMLLLNN